MIDKEKINKYDDLFESSIEFSCRIGLRNRNEIEVLTDEEILQFCNKNGISIPPVVWSYTRFFGKGSRLKNSEYNMSHSTTDYLYANSLANRKLEWLNMMTLKEYLDAKNFEINDNRDEVDSLEDDNEGIYTPTIKSLMNIEDIIIYAYDSYTRSFKFYNSKQENPILFQLINYESVSSLFYTLTNTFRNSIFTFISNYASQDFIVGKDSRLFRTSGITHIDIDYSNGFEFIKEYQTLFKDDNLNRIELKRLRDLFYLMNDQYEEENNIIRSMPEFENKFIEFLKERKFF